MSRRAFARRPCVAFADGLRLPEQRITDPKTQAQMARAKPRFLRFWADWPLAVETPGWPLAAQEEAAPGSFIADLDDNIATARALGYQVVLSAVRKPGAVKGLAGQNPKDLNACRPGGPRGAVEEPNQAYRSPADATTGGPWARWIDFLIRRYGRTPENRERCVEFLEVLNEPNWETWPHVDEHCRFVSARHAAQMIITAQKLRDRVGARSDLILLVPSVLDYARSVNGGVGTRSFDLWVDALLVELRSRGFRAGPRMAWSQHSYGDSEAGRDVMPTSWQDRRPKVNRAQLARLMLEHRGWDGWQAGRPGSPLVFLTEGGVRLSQARRNRTTQGRMLQKWLNGISDTPLGEGVAMVTNLQLFDAVTWYSGLCPTYDAAKVGRFHPYGDVFRRWAARNP